MFIQISQLAVTAAIVLVVALLWRILRNCFLSPLRSIPGPFLAKITGQWLVFKDLAGERTATIDALHKHYGTAVRVGPNEVSFSGIDTVREIYGQKTPYMKAPIYHNLSLPPLGIFSLTDRAAHSQRRRLLSHAFSQAVLYDTEPMIDSLIQKLLDRIRRGLGQPVNVLALFRSLSLDIVGELFLGQSFGALDQDEPLAYLEDVDRWFIILGIRGSFPLVYAILTKVPVPSLRHFFASKDRLVKYGRTAFYDYINKYGRVSQRKDLLTKILSEKPETGEKVLTDVEAYMEVSNLVFAGTDTTSTTLTYLFWELAKHPEWQDKLREEVSASTSNQSDIPAYTDIQDLPILDAVINESLRLHPAAPASLQRSTPPGGRTIDSYYIPEGTVVSMQCYTTQRDPNAFPEPERWDPNRWLSPHPNEAQRELFMPFSKGPRACLGKNLALMELKITTVAVIQTFGVKIGPGTTDQSMRMKDHFLAMPEAGRCDLVFNSI